MHVRNLVIGAALIVCTAAITSQVVSQDKGKGAPPAMPQLTPEEQEVMSICSTIGMPGENHKLLDNRVGKWNGAMKWWMTPDSKPMESTFTSEAKWIYDGRFISQTVQGEMMPGETFQGQSYMGYDNAEKKFFSTWMDNMSTGLMVSKGTFDAAKKSFAFTSDMFCPLAKKQVTSRITEKWTDNDHFTMEMYGPWFKTGKDYKMMEINYTRVK